MDRVDHPMNRLAPPSMKIALFRSLFRGREDVYARRFESRKTGKSGYQPACAHEWVRGLCAKTLNKRAKCTNCQYLSVTDEMVHRHLSGCDVGGRPFVMGLYPMLQDESCFLLAIDLDKHHWRKDALAIQETCIGLRLPFALERSRSGNGCHLWLFFEEAIPAALARQLGAHLITETMRCRPDLGLDSYDRLFPSQDTLPRGGFGNLIALPLQKEAREKGHTVFLDRSLTPHPDPWAFLATVKKMDRDEVERIVRKAEKRDLVVGVPFYLEQELAHTPWTAPPSRRRKPGAITGPFPAELEVVLGNELFVPKQDLSPSLHNELVRVAAFPNAEFYKAQALRLPTYGKPRIIACAEDYPNHIGLPRGCLDETRALLAGLNINMRIRDERYGGTPLNVQFQGRLRPEQQVAAKAMLAHETGVLAASTAFGKTVIAAWLIAKRGVNTLILVHRQQLLEQWVERLSSFLNMPQKEIGRIGAGSRKARGGVDVALIQSLVRKGVVQDMVGEYGYLMVDECHHIPAASFERVARQTKALYITGLTATTARKDGHHPIIFMQCGPVRYRVTAKEQAAAQPFTHNVWVRPTSFYAPMESGEDNRIGFHVLYDALIADETRNEMICKDVLHAVEDGRSPLVLTERKHHLDLLALRLLPVVPHLVVLKGGLGKKERQRIAARLKEIPDDEGRVILATGRYIGEGFDDARLDTLFLTLPVSWRGTVAQYAGRLHRIHAAKREVRIYDYADLNVPMLARMFDRRCEGYESVGYSVLLPASAVPGWPSEVPLPVEPGWKRDYAASIQRLIRDGVDMPLADLFLHAARAIAPDARGADRARSATEAFLYRRLQSLPQTRGRFRLNAALMIPFDAYSRMEVDFLCDIVRLVIEVDGAQHLGDAEAYRRDRHKDALLQEHGYFVLRFLAEDVVKRLDQTLDSVLRAIVHRDRAGVSAKR